MQTALEDINAEQRRRHLPELAMGIGINTGEVVVGNIGSEKRAKYGAVGNAINIAYCIESATVGGQILIGPITYERVRPLVRLRGTLEARFKGLKHPIALYDIASLRGNDQFALSEEAPMAFCTLTQPLPIACFPVRDKIVTDTPIRGSMIRVAVSAADILLEGRVVPHTNLKIILAPQKADGLPEVYAKVLSLDPPDAEPQHTRARLGFTLLPDDAKAFLAQQTTRYCATKLW